MAMSIPAVVLLFVGELLHVTTASNISVAAPPKGPNSGSAGHGGTAFDDWNAKGYFGDQVLAKWSIRHLGN